jgi:hypothetical protein
MSLEHLNKRDTPVLLELNSASLTELGNLLLSTYTDYLCNVSEECSEGQVASLATPIKLILNIDLEAEKDLQYREADAVELEESAVQISEDSNQADMMMLESPSKSTIADSENVLDDKKKRKSFSGATESITGSRSSKRVKQRAEEEEANKKGTKFSSHVLIRDHLDPWLPMGWKLAAEDSQNISLILPELTDFFDGLTERLTINDSESARKAKAKRKQAKERLDEYTEIGTQKSILLNGVRALELFERFISTVPDNVGLLALMEFYLSFLLENSDDLSADLCEIVKALYKRLEFHDFGIEYWLHKDVSASSSGLPQSRDTKLLTKLITLAEILYDALPRSSLSSMDDLAEWDFEKENPLTSTTPSGLFGRVWTSLVRLMQFKPLTLTPPSSPSNSDSRTSLNNTLLVRFTWLFARNEERRERLPQAVSNLELCLSLLQKLGTSLHNKHVSEEAFISQEGVGMYLKRLKARQYLLQIRHLQDSHQVPEVLDLLRPLFVPGYKRTNDSEEQEVIELAKTFVEQRDHFRMRMDLRNMFVEGLQENKKPKEAVRQSIFLLGDTLQNIVDFEAQVEIPFGFINNALQVIIEFLKRPNWAAELSSSSQFPGMNASYLELLIDECAICIKLTLHFLSLPRDFMASSLSKSMHERRLKMVEAFCLRSWILFYKVIKYILDYEASDDAELVVYAAEGERKPKTTPAESRAQILAFIHDVLGNLTMCSADQGSFLKMAVHEFNGLPLDYVRQEVHQCYHCLYGITVRVRFFFFDSLSKKIMTHIFTVGGGL